MSGAGGRAQQELQHWQLRFGRVTRDTTATSHGSCAYRSARRSVLTTSRHRRICTTFLPMVLCLQLPSPGGSKVGCLRRAR